MFSVYPSLGYYFNSQITLLVEPSSSSLLYRNLVTKHHIDLPCSSGWITTSTAGTQGRFLTFPRVSPRSHCTSCFNVVACHSIKIRYGQISSFPSSFTLSVCCSLAHQLCQTDPGQNPAAQWGLSHWHLHHQQLLRTTKHWFWQDQMNAVLEF